MSTKKGNDQHPGSKLRAWNQTWAEPALPVLGCATSPSFEKKKKKELLS